MLLDENLMLEIPRDAGRRELGLAMGADVVVDPREMRSSAARSISGHGWAKASASPAWRMY
jgi:hypothetical protein